MRCGECGNTIPSTSGWWSHLSSCSQHPSGVFGYPSFVTFQAGVEQMQECTLCFGVVRPQGWGSHTNQHKAEWDERHRLAMEEMQRQQTQTPSVPTPHTHQAHEIQGSNLEVVVNHIPKLEAEDLVMIRVKDPGGQTPDQMERFADSLRRLLKHDKIAIVALDTIEVTVLPSGERPVKKIDRCTMTSWGDRCILQAGHDVDHRYLQASEKKVDDEAVSSEEERLEKAEALTRSMWCNDVSPDGHYTCTREVQHTGDHEESSAQVGWTRR